MLIHRECSLRALIPINSFSISDADWRSGTVMNPKGITAICSVDAVISNAEELKLSQYNGEICGGFFTEANVSTEPGPFQMKHVPCQPDGESMDDTLLHDLIHRVRSVTGS